MNLSPVIVALDLPDRARAVALAKRLDCKLCRIKIGLELFTAEGPRVVEAIQKLGFEVFLDLKFHDIPNTVAAACRQAAALGVWMINVHAGGGGPMMRAALDALGGSRRPLLVAVTLLTSIGAQEFAELGYANTLNAQVSALARLSRNCGLDGVVCSPLEVAALRRELGAEAVLVTPGVRPAGSATDDQQRTATPKAALAAGASYLVIGRPVTQAASPSEALAAILDSIDRSSQPATPI